MDDSVESLPISEEPFTISLHFSPPAKEVGLADSQVFDIADETFGDEDAGSVLTFGADAIRVSHSSRISISYDVQKVDD